MSIKRTWRKYFQKLLREQQNVKSPPQQQESENNEAELKSLTLEETRKAIKAQKNNRAPGFDGIPIKLYKTAGNKLIRQHHTLIKQLHTLITNIWLANSRHIGNEASSYRYWGIRLSKIIYARWERVYISVCRKRRKSVLLSCLTDVRKLFSNFYVCKI